MVFARYVMFSEVYWHHGVRSATAMLQRAFYLLHQQLDLDALFRLTEQDWIQSLRRSAGNSPARELLDGLFGTTRRLFKRVAQYSYFEERALYDRLARRPYAWLAKCAGELPRWPARGWVVSLRRMRFCSMLPHSSARWSLTWMYTSSSSVVIVRWRRFRR